MSSEPTPSPAPAPTPPPAPAPAGNLFDRLAPHEQKVALGVIGLGVALAAIPITNAALYKGASLTTLVWGTLLSLCTLAIGIIFALPPAPHEQRRPADRLRLMALFLAGSLGFFTAMYGVCLALSSPPYFSLLNYRDIFAGGLKAWRENARAVSLCGLAVVGGLILMFLGLNLGRTFERTSQAVRRLVYGYNAVLGSLLVFFILLLLNALSYANVAPFKALGQTYDWTGSHIYTLSESTKNFLAGLKQPVKVYVLMAVRDPLTNEVETLLTNCRNVTPQISWEVLSPQSNIEEVRELVQKYRLRDVNGLLVLYGTDPKIESDFIPRADLFTIPTTGTEGSFLFKGEAALMKSLRYLAEGKTKPTVYFTQGHGELDFNEKAFQMERSDRGLGQLREELEKRNYQVRELKLTGGKPTIPADAEVVVIPGPRTKFSDEAVKVLRDYLQGTGGSTKKGKLIVLLGIVPNQTGGMEPTGLEGLLAEYGVKADNDRIINVDNPRDPLLLEAWTVPESGNPVAAAFFPATRGPSRFILDDARSVGKMQGPAASGVEDLLMTRPDQALVRESDLNASPTAVARDLRKNPQDLLKRLSQDPIIVGVAVTEGKMQMPPIPGHEGLQREGQPRLVLFGNANWLTNRLVRSQVGRNHVDLFASCVSWLRERPDIGSDVEPRERPRFTLNAPGGTLRLLFLPLLLFLVASLALAGGVWVVRRR